jgi:hypothetical protein
MHGHKNKKKNKKNSLSIKLRRQNVIRQAILGGSENIKMTHFALIYRIPGARSGVVVKALRYKPAGRGFGS